MKFPHSLFLLFIILNCALQTAAQKQGQASIDSMLALLPTQHDDTSKVRLLNNLSFTYYGVNPNEGLRYGAEGLALARKLGWREGEADACNKMGINYFIRSEYAKALQQQLAARNIYEAIGQQKNIPGVLISIGSIYQRQGDFAKAAGYFDEALQRYTALGDKRGMASGYGSLGNVYKAQGDYNKSLQYQLRALAIFEQLPYKDLLAINLKNIGATYYEQHTYPEALTYYLRAEQLVDELGYKGYQGEYLVDIGKVYLDIAGDTGLLGPGTKDHEQLMPSSKTEALNRANDYLSRALMINSQMANMNVLGDNYRLLSLAAALKNDYKSALESFIAYKEISDSLFSLEKNVAVANTQTKYGQLLKDKQSELDHVVAARKRNESIFLVAGFLLSAGVAVAAIRSRKK